MAEVLCVAPRCRTPRHQPGCTDAECAKHPAWPAAPGLRLCDRHAELIGTDATEAARLYDELALRLLGGTGGGEPVSGTAERTRLPNPAAVEARAEIRHVLVGWCRLVAEERGFSLPVDDVHAMAAYLDRCREWLAASDYADEVSDELRQLAHGHARAVAYPSGARVVEIAPCPRDGCTGMVRAIVRPSDSLLPSEMVCGVDDGHRWPASAWREFRRSAEARTTAGST